MRNRTRMITAVAAVIAALAAGSAAAVASTTRRHVGGPDVVRVAIQVLADFCPVRGGCWRRCPAASDGNPRAS
jgi:hypothetical protein